MDFGSQELEKISKMRFRAKLVWFSQTKKDTPLLEIYLLLLISHLQVFLISTRFLRDYLNEDSSSIRNGIKFFEDVITFDNLFEYSEHDGGLLGVFGIITLYFILLLGKFSVLVKTIKSFQRPAPFTVKTWSFVIRYHNPIFFFIINNLCSRVQKEYIQEESNTFNSTILNQSLFFLSIVIAILNLAVAFFIDIYFSDSLPSKNPLSSKNAYTDQINIYQKVVVTFLWRFLPLGTLTNWFIVMLNLGLSSIKNYFYYHTFPRYNFETLQFNAYMLTLEASIIFLAPFFLILRNFDDFYLSITSIIMIIVLILPLVIFFTREIVNRTVKKVIYAAFYQINPQKLIHKTIFLKDMKIYKNHPGKTRYHININKLHLFALASNIKSIFTEEDVDLTVDDFNKKEIQNSIIRQFLERMEKHYPNDNLIKLMLTMFYTTTLKLFPLAITTLAKIKSISPRINVSVDLLSLKIQEAILKHYKEDEGTLDMSEYLPTMSQAEDFYAKIQEQLDLHKQFWTEYTKNTPDSTQLYLLSEKVRKQKIIIQAQWNNSKFNKKYSQPFLLYANYLFTLNNSPLEARKCLNNYSLFFREKQENDSLNLTMENMYSEETFYVTVRTDPKHVGVISKCSPSIQKGLNYDPKSLIGININKLMSDYIARDHSKFVLQYLKTGRYKILNNMRKEFVKDHSGSLHKASLYAKIHPYFDQEIYLTSIIKPLQTFEEYILITPQGEIDSTSSGIAKKLGLVSNKISISSICKDFQEINQAFNYYGYKELNSRPQPHKNNRNSEYVNILLNLDEKFQEEIYKKWYLEGDLLKFYSFQTDLESVLQPAGNTVECFCRIHNYYFASDFLKIVVIRNMISNSKNKEHVSDFAKIQQNPNQARKPEIGIISADFSSEFVGIDEREDVKDNSKNLINRVNIPVYSESQTKYVSSSSKRLIGLKPIQNSESYTEDLASLEKLSHANANSSNYKKKQEAKTNDPSKLSGAKLQEKRTAITPSSFETNQNKRDRVYHEITSALNTKSYTQNTYILLFLICCFGLILFSVQISFYYKVRNDLRELEALGKTLDISRTGVDALVYLSRGARTIFLNQLLIIDETHSTSVTVTEYLKLFEKSIPEYLLVLKNANNNLWTELQSVDDNFRKEFLDSDVKFYDFDQNLNVETMRLVNILTATTLLENRFYYLLNNLQQSGNYSLIDLIYVIRNSCGSLAVKTKSISDIVIKYIENSITHQHMSLEIYFGVEILLIAAGFGIILYFSFRFYVLEVKNLHSYVKISDQEISRIRESLNLFETSMKSQDYHNVFQPQPISHNSHNEKSKTNVKQIYRQNLKTPQTKQLKQKYILKVTSWTIILSFYSVFLIIIYRKAYENGSNFQSGTNRLLTTQDFLENVQLSIAGFYSMFIPEYEPMIKEIPVLTLLKNSLDALSESTVDLTNAYKLIDDTLDGSFTPIFSGDICRFVPASSLSYCLLVAAGSQSRDLFSFINSLYVEITYKLDEYIFSNKTLEISQKLCTQGFLSITPIATTLRHVLIYMISLARVNFREVNEDLRSQLDIFLGVDLFLFGMLILFSWIFVMRYLIGYNNRIKRLLTITPISILVTNRSLKPLLKKSCKEIIAAIKNEF